MIYLVNKKIICFVFFISLVNFVFAPANKTSKTGTIKEFFHLALDSYVSGEYEKALLIYDTLLDIAPDNLDLSLMRAKVLKGMGCINEAMGCYKKIIRLYPNSKASYSDLGYCYFLIGDFRSGYDTHRMVGIDGSRGYSNGKSNFGPGCNFYDGRSDIAGRTILIIDENGYGDFFQWIRFAKVVKEMGANVVVRARKQLIPFLSHCPYIDSLIPENIDFQDFDFQIYSGEFYRVFRSDEKNIPADVPYLYADESLVEQWSHAFAQDKNFKIGICWEPKAYLCKDASKQFKKERAAPLSTFYSLGKLKNITLYNLQMVNGLEQLYYIPSDFKLYFFKGDFDKENGSFSDTAAVMKNLDLVITVDTSIAHLAGALGVPVWVMLPKVPDWRWMLDRDDSPWYPTMRLFRQKSSGDWGSVMADIIESLEKLLVLRG